jgi:hypothetical protein
LAKCETSLDSFENREKDPAGIETMLTVTSGNVRSVEPMPPSGSKPADGAVDIYGHHEFHVRLRRFELKTRAL